MAKLAERIGEGHVPITAVRPRNQDLLDPDDSNGQIIRHALSKFKIITHCDDPKNVVSAQELMIRRMQELGDPPFYLVGPRSQVLLTRHGENRTNPVHRQIEHVFIRGTTPETQSIIQTTPIEMKALWQHGVSSGPNGTPYNAIFCNPNGSVVTDAYGLTTPSLDNVRCIFAFVDVNGAIDGPAGHEKDVGAVIILGNP